MTDQFVDVCKQFMKCSYKDFVICTNFNSASNSYCLTNQGKVLQVQNIICVDSKTYLVVKYFQSYDSLYKYPLDSKDLKIFVLANLNPKLELCPMNEVASKCIVLFSKDQNNKCAISFPIIHTREEI